jgi:hypothetical protein
MAGEYRVPTKDAPVKIGAIASLVSDKSLAPKRRKDKKISPADPTRSANAAPKRS